MINIKKAVIIYIILHCLFNTVYAESTDDPKLMSLIKACVDIGEYDRENFDENDLMRRVLYTYRNFQIITDVEPYPTQTDDLKMCRTDFVKDVLHRAFRLDAPAPPPDKLTELGYCQNDGYYYFSGGYTEYFATDVKDIYKIIQLQDGTLYVIFTDYYFEGNNDKKLEYSSMRIGHDADGYYVLSINMNNDFKDLKPLMNPEQGSNNHQLAKYIPAIVTGITIILACIVFFIYFLRR